MGVLSGMNRLCRFSPVILLLFIFARVHLCAQSTLQGSVAEQYLFSAANAERTQRGQKPLRWNASLYRAAQGHCQEMASRASISHQYPGEAELAERGRRAGVRFSAIAENVAEAPTAVRIHDAWMNSPGHRANLLDAKMDSVGISVLRRDGQLYAVEDFGRIVAVLSLDEQESQVSSLISATVPIEMLPTTDEARQTCSMETGYAGSRRPSFVMRYTAGDLTKLPDSLKTQLASGKFHQVTVGACAPRDHQAFTSFSIAVLLYE
jgi:hypothetical protein